jgi:hypothetical protein
VSHYDRNEAEEILLTELTAEQLVQVAVGDAPVVRRTRSPKARRERRRAIAARMPDLLEKLLPKR